MHRLDAEGPDNFVLNLAVPRCVEFLGRIVASGRDGPDTDFCMKRDPRMPSCGLILLGRFAVADDFIDVIAILTFEFLGIDLLIML